MNNKIELKTNILHINEKPSMLPNLEIPKKKIITEEIKCPVNKTILIG